MMNCLKTLSGVLRVSAQQQASVNRTFRRFRRRPSVCDVCLCPPAKRKCFDIRKVLVERGNQCHSRMIRSFLYTHHWPREPTICALWARLDSPYLEVLTEKYSNSGDRFLAFEKEERTGERKLIGVCVAHKALPWMADELEEWAHVTTSKADRHRMYFSAHVLRSPDLFNKYHLPYIYDVAVLATAAEVQGQGVGKLLLKHMLANAQDLGHPLIQVVATSAYLAKICEHCGMQRAWSMEYSEFVDNAGQRVFFPRRPHYTVAIYIKYFDPTKVPPPPCLPPW